MNPDPKRGNLKNICPSFFFISPLFLVGVIGAYPATKVSSIYNTIAEFLFLGSRPLLHCLTLDDALLFVNCILLIYLILDRK